MFCLGIIITARGQGHHDSSFSNGLAIAATVACGLQLQLLVLAIFMVTYEVDALIVAYEDRSDIVQKTDHHAMTKRGEEDEESKCSSIDQHDENDAMASGEDDVESQYLNVRSHLSISAELSE